MGILRAAITGASRGIGLAVAQKLQDRGYHILSIGRSAPPLGDHITCDLSDLAAVDQMAAELPPVDVLVNNAGIMCAAPWTDYPAELERDTLAVNLQAPIRLMATVGHAMAERSGGRIVNVSSIAALIGHPDVWYGATKAALLNATRSFATLLGPRGVQVNAVAPGPVSTDMLATIPEARKAALANRALSGRFNAPDEVAATIVWLATEAPVTLNGTCLDLTDGSLLR